MEIIVGKTSGFCFGVENAVSKAEGVLRNNKNVCCLGELVHNTQVTNDLKNKGLVFINKIEEANKNVIIRAHGEPEETYKKAKEQNLNVFDFTCPKVIHIHEIAKKYSKDGFYIFLIGKKEHPEIKGTISYCGENSYVIEDENEINTAIEKLKNSDLKNLLIISQTTFSLEKFENIIGKIQEKTSKDISIKIKNTICDATKLRQEETKQIAKQVDLMIIIGGKHSSNTNKLYEIAISNCLNSILIETEEEIDINLIKKYKKIGIMAGASTPQKSIKLVVEKLNKVC